MTRPAPAHGLPPLRSSTWSSPAGTSWARSPTVPRPISPRRMCSARTG